MSDFSINEMLDMQKVFRINTKINGKSFLLKQVNTNCFG